MLLNIELKFNGHDERLVERVVEIVRGEDFVEEAVITSLDYRALEERGQRVLRVQLGAEPLNGLEALVDTVSSLG